MSALTTPLGFAKCPSTQPVNRDPDFCEKVKAEFTTGSGIHQVLFESTIDFVHDEGQWEAHQALNLDVPRFWTTRKPHNFGTLACFRNEDGSLWQAKPEYPSLDKKGKVNKYLAPKGEGSRAFLPQVPTDIRQRIQNWHQVTVPSHGSFWDWLAVHPEIPIIVTEGGKKSLSPLSLGHITIALFGCNGGYRTKDSLGNPIEAHLIPDLERFATPGRRFILAFDQDQNPSTRRRVSVAIHRFGRLLTQKGCQVDIATWNPDQGKGIDDLIVNQGAKAWEQAIQDALPLVQWQFFQRLDARIHIPANLSLDVSDLSNLSESEFNQTPTDGVVALVSAKGTGKTKLIDRLVKTSPKVLAITHRIALAKNLGARLDLTYRTDADKHKGRYITDSGYTDRIVSCVDGLLSIDPAHFTDCDLILDEVTQEVRHHLTSSTCATDGKRPVILARFADLVRNAKRVIVADADLDQATLNYIQTLRGETSSIFLIQNHFQPQPYDCRMILATDRTAVTAKLLKAAATLPAGKVIFVATDSKATSKSLARILVQQYPDKRILVLNSDTSGGEFERQFNASPDQYLQDYDIIICSPSLATGVSIESQGVIQQVFGIFTGASATDGDIAQALARVREPVPRIVWVASKGSNFSKVSRSTNPLELRGHLFELSSMTVRLIRSNLRADTVSSFEQFDWQSDPHVKLFCQLSAEQNRSMYSLREALIARLKFEGNSVSLHDLKADPAAKLLLTQSRQENLMLDAETLIRADSLSYSEILNLEAKQSIGDALNPEEKAAISKFYLMEFYGLEDLTIEDCLWDAEGRRRAEILNLEAQLSPGVAADRSAKALEKQSRWQKGCCPWDVSLAEVRRQMRDRIGLTELLERMRNGWQWSKYDLESYADKARELARHIKLTLNFTINDKVSDTQIIHQLLSQMGIVLDRHWSRSVPGHKGEKLRVYTLNPEHWQKLSAILQRRTEKRQQIQQQQAEASSDKGGSSLQIERIKQEDDPVPSLLNQARQELFSAMNSSGEAVQSLLASWPSSFRFELIAQLWDESEETIDQLVELVPDLFDF